MILMIMADNPTLSAFIIKFPAEGSPFSIHYLFYKLIINILLSDIIIRFLELIYSKIILNLCFADLNLLFFF